jgi:hypothetical protein
MRYKEFEGHLVILKWTIDRLEGNIPTRYTHIMTGKVIRVSDTELTFKPADHNSLPVRNDRIISIERLVHNYGDKNAI